MYNNYCNSCCPQHCPPAKKPCQCCGLLDCICGCLKRFADCLCKPCPPKPPCTPKPPCPPPKPPCKPCCCCVCCCSVGHKKQKPKHCKPLGVSFCDYSQTKKSDSCFIETYGVCQANSVAFFDGGCDDFDGYDC